MIKKIYKSIKYKKYGHVNNTISHQPILIPKFQNSKSNCLFEILSSTE